METIWDSIDKGKDAVGIFMDLSKAFDSVSHSILIDSFKNVDATNITLNRLRPIS